MHSHRPIVTMSLCLSIWAASLAGCFFADDAVVPPIDGRRDATVPPPVGADLAAPAEDLTDTSHPPPCELGARCPDLGFTPSSPDLTATPPDLLSTPDVAMAGDAPFCQGGYLNSNDPKACPLSCSPNVESVPDEGRFHIAYCQPQNYMHNPPASGNHWPWPAPWGIHKGVVPPNWWVHNLEHQGIVLLYNCPYPKSDGGVKLANVETDLPCSDGGSGTVPAVDNCQNEIAQLEALYNKHPQDNWWDMLFEVRIIVTQDPDLPTRFGAAAWDWTYTSNQLDVKALQCFIDARYGRGPEEAP